MGKTPYSYLPSLLLSEYCPGLVLAGCYGETFHFNNFLFEPQSMPKLFVRGLPQTTTEDSLNALFSRYGKVFSLNVSQDLFSGKARGFATVDMEGHQARAAIAGLDGHDFEGNTIYVAFDKASKEARRRR
jgi:RNA recognition motif-containing protein